MDLIHPLVLEIGMPVLAALFLALHLIRKKTKYTTGKKVSNTSFLKELPIYKKRKKLYQGTAIAIEILLVIALAMSLLMMSRPAIKQTTSNGTKKRDIFLCMDVSYSICDLNYELVESLKGVVEGLDGDRFGISIYNTTTVLYVPMTDDYDFIIEKLDELHNYFDLQKQYLDEFGEYIYGNSYYTYDDIDWDRYYELQEELDYYDAGTLVNNYTKGSSLIGEGLASCVYNFPRLSDEDRTRIIIMSTDNAQEELVSPIIELDEAAELCSKYDITVFGIFPNKDTFSWMNTSDYESDEKEFRTAVESTGGTYYKQSENLTVDDIVADIEEQEAMEVDEIIMTKLVDQPKAPYIIILISVGAIIIIGAVIRV